MELINIQKNIVEPKKTGYCVFWGCCVFWFFLCVLFILFVCFVVVTKKESEKVHTRR